MRPRNPVSIIRRPDSRWYTIGLYVEGKRRRVSGKQYGLDSTRMTPEEAARIVLEAINRPQADKVTSKPDLSVLGGIYGAMEPRLKMEGISEKTIKEYRIALKHLADILGAEYPTAEVSKAHIPAIQAGLSKLKPPRTKDKTAHIATTTVNKIMRHLQGVFSRLYDDETIPRNPFHKFKRLREPYRSKTLTRDEAAAFLKSIAGDEEKYMPRALVARILLYTGLRLNEIMEMPRGNIDLERMLFLVALEKTRGKSVRYWLPIHPKIQGDVRALCESNTPKPFHVCHCSVESHWIKKHMRAIGRNDLNCHSLRHTLVTLAGEAGEEMWKIRAQLGHSSQTVTDGYFHAVLESPIDPRIE